MFMSRQARANAAKAAEGVVVPVIEAQPLGVDVLADVAARYGVQISAGARAVALPRGAAGTVFAPNAQGVLVMVRPRLVVEGDEVAAGGAIGAAAFRKGNTFRARKGPTAQTLAVQERLRGLHAQGQTDGQMAEALGLTGEYVGQMRRAMGLPVNARVTVVDARLGDTAFMQRLREMVGQGVGVLEMAAGLGMNRWMLRDLLVRAGLQEAVRKKPATKGGRKRQESCVLDPFKERILAEYAAGHGARAIAAGLGVWRSAVDRALVRWKARPEPVRMPGKAALAQRNAVMIGRLEAGEDPAVVAAETGVALKRMARLWRAARRAAGHPMGQDLARAEARDAALLVDHARGICVANLTLRYAIPARQVQSILRAGVV